MDRWPSVYVHYFAKHYRSGVDMVRDQSRGTEWKRSGSTKAPRSEARVTAQTTFTGLVLFTALFPGPGKQ